MQKNKILLIGTTQGGREKQIERLLNSLINFDNIELIFVDQSHHDDVKVLFERFSGIVNFQLIKSEKCSLSKARNIALSQGKGDIVGFCDDDAFYEKDMLLFLSHYNIKYNCIVSFPVIDPTSNKDYGNRNFPKKDKNLTFNSILKYSLSVGTFIFNKDNAMPFFFSEKFGAGAKYGGSEESELFFRLKTAGYRSSFITKCRVYHDNDSLLDHDVISDKYFKYAVGYGLLIKTYLLKSNFLLFIEFSRVLLRSFIGVLFSKNKVLYFKRIKGLVLGFFTEEKIF